MCTNAKLKGVYGFYKIGTAFFTGLTEQGVTKVPAQLETIAGVGFLAFDGEENKDGNGGVTGNTSTLQITRKLETITGLDLISPGVKKPPILTDDPPIDPPPTGGWYQVNPNCTFQLWGPDGVIVCWGVIVDDHQFFGLSMEGGGHTSLVIGKKSSSAQLPVP